MGTCMDERERECVCVYVKEREREIEEGVCDCVFTIKTGEREVGAF